ncbi:hypothetical protein SLS60_004440 [Paraconiothyrium brasiliense]|uniref:Uncharacterized protein n=1 Tax=Paraconiothyrium brasiliense TaxID=300254 RepID=A0ABR3RKC7_9PLEO
MNILEMWGSLLFLASQPYDLQRNLPDVRAFADGLYDWRQSPDSTHPGTGLQRRTAIRLLAVSQQHQSVEEGVLPLDALAEVVDTYIHPDARPGAHYGRQAEGCKAKTRKQQNERHPEIEDEAIEELQIGQRLRDDPTHPYIILAHLIWEVIPRDWLRNKSMQALYKDVACDEETIIESCKKYLAPTDPLKKAYYEARVAARDQAAQADWQYKEDLQLRTTLSEGSKFPGKFWPLGKGYNTTHTQFKSFWISNHNENQRLQDG